MVTRKLTIQKQRLFVAGWSKLRQWGTSMELLQHPLFGFFNWAHLLIGAGFSGWLLRGTIISSKCVSLDCHRSKVIRVQLRSHIPVLWLCCARIRHLRVWCDLFASSRAEQITSFSAIHAMSLVLDRNLISFKSICTAIALGVDLMLLSWQTPVVNETYKYFRMCKTLIEMAEK